MKKHQSHILAVSSESAALAASGAINGFKEFDEGAERFPFDVNDIWVGPRALLEQITNFKQVIPYVIVERDGKILVYRRASKGGESRLHGNTSIGFGGHIDMQDIEVSESGEAINLEASIARATERELREELNANITAFTAIGVILDESNDVGKVHIGIVMSAHVGSGEMVLSNEDEIDLQGFKSVEEIDEESLESWSKIVVSHLQLQQIAQKVAA